MHYEPDTYLYCNILLIINMNAYCCARCDESRNINLHIILVQVIGYKWQYCYVLNISGFNCSQFPCRIYVPVVNSYGKIDVQEKVCAMRKCNSTVVYCLWCLLPWFDHCISSLLPFKMSLIKPASNILKVGKEQTSFTPISHPFIKRNKTLSFLSYSCAFCW